MGNNVACTEELATADREAGKATSSPIPSEGVPPIGSEAGSGRVEEVEAGGWAAPARVVVVWKGMGRVEGVIGAPDDSLPAA